MNTEPNIIINIGGDHPARSLVAGIIADALEKSGVNNISHLDYDAVTFTEMRKAISESHANKLSTAVVVLVEWEDDEIDAAFTEPDVSESSTE